MSCKPYDIYIMKYIDGELNDIERAQLMHHISECKECNNELKGLEDVLVELESSSELEPPLDFQKSVMERVYTMDIYNKKLKEKKLMILYFISTLTFSILLLSLGMLFRNNVLDMMIYFKMPVKVAYYVYGILTRMAAETSIIIEVVIYFKNMLSDFYYVLAGLFVITLMSKVYEINRINSLKNTKRAE